MEAIFELCAPFGDQFGRYSLIKLLIDLMGDLDVAYAVFMRPVDIATSAIVLNDFNRELIALDEILLSLAHKVDVMCLFMNHITASFDELNAATL